MDDGVTVMEFDVLLLLQVLEVPPVEVSVTLWPMQIAVSREMVVATVGCTVTLTVSVTEQ